ncbi:MAG: AmmeMemoRadiSam system radical SAM enzyme [Elusimicrobia bacterium RIFOXYA2_FULL_39_19]|nr:MAG: AmmeMemoRadiSam system radical SAM enzyme [Elusimicrobia bacterium RIFOXYA2_FULL_39_19]
MKEALYYSVIDKNRQVIQCNLCPNNCKLSPEKTGLCKARKNVSGRLYSLTYGKVSSVNLDPIEKKPLYHFYPGTEILSVGATGCNFKCLNCQNWEISQADFKEESLRDLSSQEALEICKRYKSVGLAYTYNEPLINYEWVLETAKLFRENNLKNVLVTNGYINEQPLVNLLPYIDAANIDIKAFKNDFYKKVCGGELGSVMRTVEIMYEAGVHIELTCLLIPGQNDSENEISDFASWVSSLNCEIPVHFSRYFPRYKMKDSATSFNVMERARKTALRYLKYVYLGNITEEESSKTFCVECGNVLIERIGYDIELRGLQKGSFCRKCKTKNNIIY